jgi:hypothetical protein
VSALMAGVRAAAGHPSGPEIAADTGLATRAGHQPSGRRSSPKQRTVNPPIAPIRYNFLYASSRPALRAAACDGRPRPATASRSPGAAEFEALASSSGCMAVAYR